MKKILTTLFAITLFCGYGTAQIIIHTSEIEKFHNIMKYIEEKAGEKLSCKQGDTTELQTAFEKNSKDSKLTALIDSLVNTSVRYKWRDTRDVTVRNFSKKTPIAKEAYRVAFTVLSDFCVDITSNMTETWVEYWNSYEQRERIENAVIELRTNMEAIVESMTTDLKTLLPDDVDMNAEVNIHLIIDGHASGFMGGNHIVMDVLDEDFADFSNFFTVLTHEMHHVYYGNWLVKRFGNKERNESESYLINYQVRFIIEGIATRYNFSLAPSEVKQMFANRELIAELFDEWISLMRGMSGDSPQEAWAVFRDYSGERSLERMKKYWQGDPDSIERERGYHPTVVYYVSYNLYNLIFEHGGHEKLKYVIENPEKLLSVYNELYTNSMLVPRIPDDIVILWQNNF